MKSRNVCLFTKEILSEFLFQHLYIECICKKLFAFDIKDIHTIYFVKYSYYVQEFLLNVQKDLRNFYCYEIYFF